MANLKLHPWILVVLDRIGDIGRGEVHAMNGVDRGMPWQREAERTRAAGDVQDLRAVVDAREFQEGQGKPAAPATHLQLVNLRHRDAVKVDQDMTPGASSVDIFPMND